MDRSSKTKRKRRSVKRQSGVKTIGLDLLRKRVGVAVFCLFAVFLTFSAVFAEPNEQVGIEDTIVFDEEEVLGRQEILFFDTSGEENMGSDASRGRLSIHYNRENAFPSLVVFIQQYYSLCPLWM